MDFQKATTDELAKVLWDYNNLNQPLERTDAIFVMGGNDLRVAAYGAELLLQGLAPHLIYSGNVGVFTKGFFDRPEADVFTDQAIAMGVPPEKIISENVSTNTGENIQFVKALLKNRGLHPHTLIVVQAPYLSRRMFGTIQKQWPEVEVRMSSPTIAFSDYPNDVLPKDMVISMMVGNTQRIREYPKQGFQVAQEIPDDVWAAYEELVRRGFNRHLIH